MTMSRFLSKLFSNSFLLVLITLVIKIPIFLTKHLQEDSFITWRVARNLLDYGVIGFNGEERISSSTTHLYVAISAAFQVVFGDDFIYPLLIFSSILFAAGSLLIAKMLFPHNLLKRGFFVILLNMTPPALAASCLGMEYGILFFLYSILIYSGIYKNRRWAFVLIPILLLWTRMDTVIFLGVFFLADLYLRKKINYFFILGGLVGLISIVGFNYLYFGELVNHTITAKKLAYKNLIRGNGLQFFLYQWAYYGGLIKKYSLVTLLVFLAFLGFLGFCLDRIFKDQSRLQFRTKVILMSMAIFALLKITAFAVLKAYFDWYYWLPRVFLFVIVIYFLLNYVRWKKQIYVPAIFVLFFGLYGFQLLQSYAIGYMEETQRVQIAKDIAAHNTDINQSILLEPAGKIPFYTDLYTYDEVGLVNKRINVEMEKDEKYWWMNSVRELKPDYILTIIKKPGEGSYYLMKDGDMQYFDDHYQFQKMYSISEIHQNSPAILQWIYRIRPIGQDYFLYKKRIHPN